jgi:hypothetical protein
MENINWPELFDELCKDFEYKLNHLLPPKGGFVAKKTVELKSMHYPSAGGFVFELRLEIERTCTFREMVYYEMGYPKEKAEQTAYLRLLKATFCYGADAAKKLIDQMLNPT